jgi:LPPG:FO 2-phospho-L-lactate transferase
MQVAVLAGGVGAARFLTGLVQVVDADQVTVVVNVADDEELHGLWISPDIDTITYTCAAAIDPDRGWGLAGETWRAMEELKRIAASNDRDDLAWFNLGDRDLGTHLYRTTRRAQGASLSQITAEIAHAWGIKMTMHPVSDDRIATRVATEDGELSFQEYFVREQHAVRATEVHFEGADAATPAPGVIAALEQADVVVIAPSNPIVSIGPVLAVPGVRETISARRDSVVGVSPIVGGKALKGPADRLLLELGHDSSVAGVARIYRDLMATLIVDTVDDAATDSVEAEGLRCVVTPTVMSEPRIAAQLAQTCLDAVGDAR